MEENKQEYRTRGIDNNNGKRQNCADNIGSEIFVELSIQRILK